VNTFESYRCALYYRRINGLHACGICTKKQAENQGDGEIERLAISYA
jgi:hypothetical protein